MKTVKYKGSVYIKTSGKDDKVLSLVTELDNVMRDVYNEVGSEEKMGILPYYKPQFDSLVEQAKANLKKDIAAFKAFLKKIVKEKAQDAPKYI